MVFSTILLYFISSIILFFIQNKIDKNDNNYIDNIIMANIYIIVISGIFNGNGLLHNDKNIYIIIILELMLRLFYYNYIIESNYFKDNTYNQKKYFFMIISAYLTTILFINKTDIVFPKIENIKIIIWLLIVIYIYNYFKSNVDVKKKKINNISSDKSTEKIIMDYAKFKSRYHDIIKTRYKELILVIYSIMIFENNRKPEFFRNLDKYLYKFNNKKRKYGIMGVESYYPIDDIKSINLSVKHLERIYSRLINQKKNIKDIGLIINKYYKHSNNTEQILFIYNTIVLFKTKD